MSPLGIVQLLASLASVAVAVDQQPDGKQVRIIGIPVWDSRWPGVKRRQARRQARRDKRAAEDKADMLAHVQAYTDSLPDPKAKK